MVKFQRGEHMVPHKHETDKEGRKVVSEKGHKTTTETPSMPIAPELELPSSSPMKIKLIEAVKK